MKRLALLAFATVLCGGVAAAQNPSYTGQGQQSSGMQDQGTPAPQGQTGQTDQSQTGQTGKHRWGMSRHFRGTVQSVDATSGRLTVRDKKGNTKDFMAGSNAKIMQGRTKVSIDALNVGDEVSVSYKGTGATPQAEKVWIRKGGK